ncbi:hypothetical protein Vadar_011663 [Vaccinium darrowii]|uniref:Uncharacterized protein n=1 Tax=Vaccinium darrowii TaxID=229202 RepID=A0ACB7YF94_9ERIC|nr:hypothetical protein Vadar_011663 [Vaccinium darrowii]
MGRGKVELKRIENKINRQVTFAKRRNGLLKKAYELSLLCDAEVALIIFSTRGKLYEFCSSSSMLQTFERYQKCSYGSLDPIQPAENESQVNHHEYLRIKARVEVLQRSQRNLLGEDLGSLTIKELEQLEHQLEISMKQIRSTKTQLLLDQLADSQRRERLVIESNRSLLRKLEETTTENCHRLSWEDGGQDIHCSRIPAVSEGFFQPVEQNPILPIGYNSVSPNEIHVMAPAQNVNQFIPGWMH